MSTFTVLVLCIQALLIQTVMSQQYNCGCASNSYRSSPISISYSSGSSSSSSSSCDDVGQGTGQVGVSGTIDTCGSTSVTGAVPVLGSVSFCGSIPACGSISVCGQCGCDCQ